MCVPTIIRGIRCPKCRAQIEVPGYYADQAKEAKCPKCGELFVVVYIPNEPEAKQYKPPPSAPGSSFFTIGWLLIILSVPIMYMAEDGAVLAVGVIAGTIIIGISRIIDYGGRCLDAQKRIAELLIDIKKIIDKS